MYARCPQLHFDVLLHVDLHLLPLRILELRLLMPFDLHLELEMLHLLRLFLYLLEEVLILELRLLMPFDLHLELEMLHLLPPNG